MSLHIISPYNYKNTIHRNISLTGTDHCNSKPCKRIDFGKHIHFSFFLIFQKIGKKNESPKVATWKDSAFPSKKINSNLVFWRK